MKRILSLSLVLTLLVFCFNSQANAIIVGEDTIGSVIVSTTDTDELFRLRAQLLMDPNSTQEQIDTIDAQLLSLGLEKISAIEVAQKLGATAQPMYDVSSTTNTTWFSERRVTVTNGRQYEIQIITGQWNNRNSPLCKYISGVKRTYSGKAVGAVNALQVLANDVVTSSISNVFPEIGSTLSLATTLYDVRKAYDEGLSPTSIIEDADYSFDILIGTTAKYGFVKSYGAVDEGNQILGYVGNQVNYSVYIDIPIFTNVNGVQTIERKTITYSDSSRSYGFDNDTCVAVAGQNCWLYKNGYSNLDVYHDIYRMSIVLLDTTENIIIPSEFPNIS